MEIICPRCAKVQEIMPEDLIGRCLICQECHYVFLWKDFVTNKEPRRTNKKAPKSAQSDPLSK